MVLCKHAVQDPDVADKHQYITKWLRQCINWSPEVSQLLIPLGSMVWPADTSSTKSSLASSKAASLKKSVKKTAKAVARLFKKLKQSLSVTSSQRLSQSQSSVILPLSDNESGNNNEPDDNKPGDDTSSSGRQNVGDESEPEEAEITPEKELGV